MKSTKTMGTILGGVAVGMLFLLVTLPAQAKEIHFSSGQYEASQEQMGEAIKDVAFYRWNMGRVQEEAGEFIQKGGARGHIAQEGLGSWIAAAGHLQWKLARAEEGLGASIVRVAQAATGRTQEELGSIIASNAQVRVAEAAAETQMALGREIRDKAHVQWASGVMSETLYATLRGEISDPIAPSTLQTLRTASGGFETEANFRLALTLLENETGQSLAQVLPTKAAPVLVGSTYLQGESGGLGGFAEFGLWALAGFGFVGWMFFRESINTMLPYPEAEEEATWEYKEAA